MKLIGLENHSEESLADGPLEEQAAAKHGSMIAPNRKTIRIDPVRDTAKIPDLKRPGYEA